ncbi:MAG: acetyl-CoA carboxylase biotin carboxyl carrier protein [Lachnospiraceae bacterium]|nr:acetyl-CoA carboxylase biotin carboxyl carrier protein [Lachnospiraceae bacterium]
MDIEKILKIMDRFDNSNMTSLRLEDEDFCLNLKSEKQVVVADKTEVISTAVQALSTTETIVEKTGAKEGKIMTSPLVGTFYAAKAEGEKPFISVGDKVTKGQTIGIIEAMKLMNEVEAEADGTVAEIYVENEQLVEYGQPLVRLV